MRKRTLLISLLLILTLALAACASGENQDEVEATIFPTGDGGQPQVPNTGQTGVPTDGFTDPTDWATEQATPAGTGIATDAATESATEAVTGTATAAATEMATESPTAEATGAMDATPTRSAGDADDDDDDNDEEETAQPTRRAQATPRATTTRAVSAGQGGDDDFDREGVIGIPEQGGLVGLAALYDFSVVDDSGEEIGAVADFIVNACEANIVYIVVDRANGDQILVPYQATLETPNDGRVDVENRELVIAVPAGDLDQAPTVDLADLDMQDPTWEAEVLDFWRSDLTLSLTTACSVPAGNLDDSDQAQATPSPDAMVTGTPAASPTRGSTGGDRQTIYRIALASEMFGADLREGNGTRLGALRDAAVVAETGRTQFLLFAPDNAAEGDNSLLIPLPPGAVTVNYEDDEPFFVLLVDTNLFRSAPSFDPDSGSTGGEWFNFWDMHIPMTLDELP